MMGLCLGPYWGYDGSMFGPMLGHGPSGPVCARLGPWTTCVHMGPYRPFYAYGHIKANRRACELQVVVVVVT
jgi:hypothetical protein